MRPVTTGRSQVRFIPLAVTRQGGATAHLGPKAPTTFKSLLKMLQESRARNFSLLRDVAAARDECHGRVPVPVFTESAAQPAQIGLDCRAERSIAVGVACTEWT